MLATTKAIILIISTLLVIHPTLSYETKASHDRRFNFFNKVSELSNNTLYVSNNTVGGLGLRTSIFTSPKQLAFKVPRNMTMSPYNNFPFKFEFIDFLLEIPDLQNTLGREQQVSVFVLTYYLMYYLYAPKDKIRQYIIDNKIEEYYNLPEVSEEMKDAYPEIVTNAVSMEDEHYKELNHLGYNLDRRNFLNGVFSHINYKFYKNKHSIMVVPWISKIESFLHCYGLVMSRSMTLRLSEYYVISDYKERRKTMGKWEIHNEEKNKMIGQNTGVPAMISFIDLTNHYQPKYLNNKDRRFIYIDAEKGYIVHKFSQYSKPGDELLYSYSSDPSNANLYNNYGIVIKDNFFNIMSIKVVDKTADTFTASQIGLCKEMNCLYDPNTVEAEKMHKEFRVNTRSMEICKFLINYARVKYLKGDFIKKLIMKKLITGNPISFDNEMNAWLFYMRMYMINMVSDNLPINRSIENLQLFRKKVKQLEENWDDKNVDMMDEWKNAAFHLKNFEFDISFKKILLTHLNVSLDKIITTVKTDLDDIKRKYME